MGRKILVTGGSGLVGCAVKHVVNTEQPDTPYGPQIDDDWVFISSRDCDLRDFEATRRLFERVRPTHVLHLAAKVGGLFANMASPQSFLRDNIAMNDSVLQNALDFGAVKVVSCLSTCIFPDVVEYPLTEDTVHAGPPHSSNFGYAYAKRLVDVQNHAYHQQHGSMFTSVIPTNVFGPADNYDLTNAHVIPALIHKCYIAKRDGTPFIVAGSGKPLRQFIYSQDLARLMLWTMNSYDSVEPLILSPPDHDEIPIRTIAEAIAGALGYDNGLEMDASKPDGQYRKPASNAKLARLLPEPFTFTPFDQALQASVQWFVDHYSSGARIGPTQQ